jgi:hypothetical protein
MIEWLKWRIARREMEELEQWRIEWEEHRRWFAEFKSVAVVLDRMKSEVDGQPVRSVSAVRDSLRAAGIEGEK